MKKILCFLMSLVPFWANAQMNTWENFNFYQINHPFKKNDTIPIIPVKDANVNTWMINNKVLLKINGTDTTKFTNFPSDSINYYSYGLNASGDKVSFLYYNYAYVGGTYKYLNYLGFYNGNELKFIPESDMGITPTVSSFSTIKQTSKYIWLLKNDRLIRFDKGNSFKVYQSADVPFSGEKISPSLFQPDADHVIFKGKDQDYVFDDNKENWEPLLSDDIVKNQLFSDSSKILYINGKNKVYQYANNTLTGYAIPDSTILGTYGNLQELKAGVALYNFSKGFVLMANGQVFIQKFSDYSNNTNPYYFNYKFNLKSLFLDNGTLILSFSSKEENLYFSFANNQVNLEDKRPVNYSAFFYKSNSGDKYYYELKFDQSRLPRPYTLTIIKNSLDSTILTLPEPTNYVMDIAADSNYIYLNNEQTPLSPYRIMRMKRDQYFVKGNLFYDNNKNGIKDLGEVGVSKYPLLIKPSGITVYADRNGNFAFAGIPGEKYTLEIPADSLFEYVSKPLPHTFIDSEKNAIGITLLNPIADVRTNFYIPWSRCGTTGNATLRIENAAYETIEKVRLTLIADPLTEIHSTSGEEKGNDTLVFEVDNISPLNAESIPYSVKFPGETHVGEKLTFKLLTEVYAKGSIVKYYEDSLTTIVRCSFDPNDKAVTPAGVGERNLTLKHVTLDYLIRFENTGNDTAYTVTVHDTLDANLDPSTLEVLGSSHKVITNLSNDGKISFHFENIMLPDSTTNKEKAQGFIRFSISPRKDLADETVIKNKAGIVFDNNTPVITNEVVNTLVTRFPIVASIDSKTELSRLIYPNPANNFVKVNHSLETNVEVYDFTGKKILETSASEINTSDWENGLYVFRLLDSNGKLIGTEKVLIND